MLYLTIFTNAIGTRDHSQNKRVCAKLHDMSTNSSGAEWAGVLLEDAIAVVLVNEMTEQRYTATEIQKRSGVKPRSWANYYVSREREIPTQAWVATGAALGLDPVEVIRRARLIVDSLDAAQVELLAAMSGRTRVQMLREIVRGGSVGPRRLARADEDDGYRRVG